MEDYAGNSKRSKEPKLEKPLVEKVATGKVMKKGLGQKFKDVFIAVDLKSVTRYVIYDICIPAFQNMLVDGVSKGIARMTYGERSIHRPGGYGVGSRTVYNSPPMRRASYPTVDNLDRTGLPPRPQLAGRQSLETDVVLDTKEDAALVLERMVDIVDQYQIVTVGDLKSLVEIPSTHVDESWGWDDLSDVQIRHTRDGYLIDLPQPQPIR